MNKITRTLRTVWISVFVFQGVNGMELLGEEPLVLRAAKARDAISEEGLKKNAAQVPNLRAHFQAKTKPVIGDQPSVQSSLWTHSIILSDGSYFTLIPVGSILHLPQNLRQHVVSKPEGQFTFWPNFLKRNNAWLEVREVSLELSRGDQKAMRALARDMERHPRLLVAVYKGGPITVLEPARQEEDKTKP